ncbi:MAG: alpha-amylase, partial [Deltaproteobacteria bacterium]|nr:alpha-amylase [Deltaproteobacteria bacterium]
MPEVVFTYHTGTTKELFQNVRLTGNWTAEGRLSDTWTVAPMEPYRDEAGCRAYRATVAFAPEEAGKEFSWGVIMDAPGRVDLWGVAEETGPFASSELHLPFTLGTERGEQSYFLSTGRYLGANKWYRPGVDAPGIRFSVWAPHAQNVETVIAADESGGYIGNDGKGEGARFAMRRDGSGIWATDPADPALAEYARFEHSRYMFKITREDGSVAYRTDIYSRSQAGKGGVNPEEAEWSGKCDDLESTKSCSVVKDPDRVNEADEPGGAGSWKDADAFWEREFSPLAPVPSSLEDLVIYEMHIAGLGAGEEGPGTLWDAIKMLDYLTDLGVNAVELLPVSEFEGVAGWGYGSSHFHAIKYDREGLDLFKRFVRECHRRGIAVIVDVVYNHYSPDSERVHWMYDAARHDRNMYYYYKGKQEDYPEDFPEGGYCDNYSTGYLPNVGERAVRAMMTGSAAALLLDYHVDGFRMDLTQALHSFNVLHKDGSPVPEANESGIRFMREWARTLRLYKPGVFLLAEDHSGWNMMAKAQKIGGVGFDAVWWSEWYHQLIGDSDQDGAKAHLLRNMG